MTTQPLKNIAIVAHVDHGKTTLVDGLLRQSGAFGEREELVERVMDSGDIERERGITITAKNCAVYWKNTKINLLDTPGHSDFGGEVERALKMVDGVLLLVDAAEGPLPQTRFVLTKALAQGLKVGVVINKVDRPDERIEEVKHEIEELFLELADFLELHDFDLDIPFMYASAKEGWGAMEWPTEKKNLHDILDFMASDFFPNPKVAEGNSLQLLTTNLSYSSYLGSLLIGRIERGTVEKNTIYKCIREDGKEEQFKVSSIQIFHGLGNKEVDSASGGEIVQISGLNEPHIGDSILSLEANDPLERITVDPPTVSIQVSVNTGPLSGKEGEYLTSRKLEEFLEDTCKLNVAVKYAPTDDPKVYTVMGRGELQLAIIFEELRRKGFEFMLARPQVLFKDSDEGRLEPYELVVMDVPSDVVGAVTEKMAKRKGIMKHMVPIGETRTRLEFEIPSRGMIGYRSTFLTDTRGEGIMSSQYDGHKSYAGDILGRQNGAIISDRAGKITPYALFNLLSNGKQYVKPGEATYEGMIIGEHNKFNDCNVNCVREKHLSSVRTAGKDQNIILPPVPPRSLEWAIDWIDNDEWVEVTPESIRVRKKVLPANQRSVQRTPKEQ